MPIEVGPDGPIPAPIMIVGEAPGEEEIRTGKPFMGAAGAELNKLLAEAGIARGQCFVTNVVRERPPKNDINAFIPQTKKEITSDCVEINSRMVRPPVVRGIKLLNLEIASVKPNVIIALGNTPLWALTGASGISKWRGSMLYANGVKLIPTFHPAAVLRQWDLRAITLQDLRRAARFRSGAAFPLPGWQFTLRPTYEQVLLILSQLQNRLDSGERLRLSFDLETRAGHIACAGISWDRVHGLCIPFMQVTTPAGYWSEDQEAVIVFRLARVLCSQNARVVGQNLLYDAQYTWRHWRFVPNVVQDTMVSEHSLFSSQPKALAFIASKYCDYYVYWKDEGKTWGQTMNEDQLWAYNCQDCVYTDEAGLAQLSAARKLGLEKVHDQQQKLFWPVLTAMLRGMRIDIKRRDELIKDLHFEIMRRQDFLLNVLGHPINPDSPKQLHTLFYQDLKLPVQLKRGKKGAPSKPTLDDEALNKLAKIEPFVKPIVNAILDIRTFRKFLSNVLERPLDADGRMRCSFNIGGSESGKSAPKTFRLSSSESAFGTGTNLQVIPSEKSKSLNKASSRGSITYLGDPYQFPNLRDIFIPDVEMSWFDMDLERADLFVVCWEAEDELLKAAMRLGTDIHLLNAFVISGKEPPPLEELVESHPKYWSYRGPLKATREFAKTFCHGTNYGGGPRTMAANTGRTVAEIERAQRIWFGAHPGIKKWHDRVEAQVRRYRFVENHFGYRWYIFDRVDGILPEALAWIPQSTVSNYINKIWQNIYENLPEVEVLGQVHDSLCGQMRTDMVDSLVPQIKSQARIVVPYSDPLVIPVNIKTSERSWGAC